MNSIDVVGSSTDQLEALALSEGVRDLIPSHFFSDGVYIRAVIMKADEPLIIGHRHNTRHFNIVMTGKAWVSQNGEVTLIQAPDVFESQIGVRKSLYILEDMIWLTVHPHKGKEEFTQEMEDHFVTKTDTFNAYEREKAAFLESIERLDS
jgi:hypothetical protein